MFSFIKILRCYIFIRIYFPLCRFTISLFFCYFITMLLILKRKERQRDKEKKLKHFFFFFLNFNICLWHARLTIVFDFFHFHLVVLHTVSLCFFFLIFTTITVRFPHWYWVLWLCIFFGFIEFVL